MLPVWIMGWAPDLRDCGGLVSLGEQTLADPWGLLGSGGPVLLQGEPEQCGCYYPNHRLSTSAR